MEEKLLSKELLDFMGDIIKYYEKVENIYFSISGGYSVSFIFRQLKEIFEKIKKSKYYKEFNESYNIENDFYKLRNYLIDKDLL